MGFAGGSEGKEFTCYVGDLGSVPGWRRSPGGGHGNPLQDFPGSSASKEFTCKTGNPGLIPRSGRSPGEGIGYPLQYSLVAQTVTNMPVMRKTFSSGMAEGMATHSGIVAWRIPMDRGAWWATAHGVAESDTSE